MGCPSGRGPCIWTSYVTSVPFCFGLCRCERKECPFLCITCVPLRPEPRPLGAEGPRGVHYGYGVQVGPNVPLNVHRLQYEPQLTRNDRLGGLGGGWKYQPLPPRNVFISICTSLACSLWTRSSIQKSTHFLWCSCFFWTQKENFLLDSRLVAPRGGACLLPATHLGCLTVMRCSFSSQCSGNNYLKNS